MQVQLLSFGFKYGQPSTVNYIWDVRFLVNPYWVEELKPFTGLHAPVAAYVLEHQRSRDFLELIQPMALFLIEQNRMADKQECVLAIGCTGGRHRSVAVTEKLKEYLTEKGIPLAVTHRDIEKDGS